MPDDARLVHDGVIFKVYQWEQKLFDGSTATFEKLVRSDTVNVLPVKNNRILLTRQEQPGVSRFVGAVGGRVDAGEEPLDAAKRELLEEAGLESNDWVLYDAMQINEKIDWATYIYIARNCRAIASSNPDAGEKIELVEYTFEEFVQAVKRPNYRDIEITLTVAYAEAKAGGLNKLRRLTMS